MKNRTVFNTKDYGMFDKDPQNRAVGNVSKLVESMKTHGFLPDFPIRVVESKHGFIIRDGQNRFEAAKSLGLPIWYIIGGEDTLTSAVENVYKKPWTIKDFVSSFRDNKHYESLAFWCARTGMGFSVAASILMGKVGRGQEAVRSGTFEVSDITFANKVNDVRLAIKDQGISWSNDSRLIKAIASILLYTDADFTRLCRRISTNGAKIVKQPTVEAFIQMLEEIYNHNAKASDKLPISHNVKCRIQEIQNRNRDKASEARSK